jgi:probable phosphoglycerate mutase
VRETLVYLVRHAEPVLPDDRPRFVGWYDPPLSAAGVEQARRLAERLRSVRFDSIYSSDLQRCRATAQIVAAGAPASTGAAPADSAGTAAGRAPTGALVAEVRPDERLREIDLGLWELLTFAEARRLYPEEYAQRERDLVGYRFPGGESFRDLRERVVPALWEIVEQGGETILVVTHLGVIRVFLCECLGLPLERLFSIGRGYGSVDVLQVSTTPTGVRRVEVVDQGWPPGGRALTASAPELRRPRFRVRRSATGAARPRRSRTARRR